MGAENGKTALGGAAAQGGNGVGTNYPDYTTDGAETQHVDLLEAALALWQRGAAVVPIPRAGIEYTDKRGRRCITSGKGPDFTPGWQSRRLGREDLKQRLTSENGDLAGIGVIAGRLSGNRVCLDFDGEGWKGAFDNFIDAWDELSQSPMVQTGSGKRHVWVRCPDLPDHVTNHRYNRPDLQATIELRANASNVVMPPSLHPSGNRYSWLTTDATLIDVPYGELQRWLAEWAGEPDEAAPKGPAPAIADRIPAGSRNATLTSLAGTMRRRGMGELEIRAALSETNRLRCDPPLDDAEVGQIAASVARYEPAPAPPRQQEAAPARQQEAAPPATSASVPARAVLDAYARNEAGDAELLAQMYAGQVVYDHAERQWYLWREHYWRADTQDAVVNLVCGPLAARYLEVAAMQREIGEAADEELIKGLLKRSGALQYRNRINNVLALAASQPALALAGDEWDRDPWLLGCANGAINLRTGDFRPGRSEDYIRAVCPTPWQGLDAPAPRWEQFLEEVLGGDGEMVSFLKRLLGYGLTGLAIEHILPIAWGTGRNGKDTLFTTLAAVLGPDLAGPVETGALLDKPRNAEAPAPALYSLRFKRMVWASETNEEMRLNPGHVKQLTGGGAFQARTLHSKPVVITPRYLPWLMTNHKPHAPADDVALWDRLLLIPFERRFVDEPKDGEYKRDPHLADTLAAEAPGILASIVLGCLDWQAHGLNPPAVVRKATQAYQDDEDDLGRFLGEQCVMSPTAQVLASALYAAYVAWCTGNGIHHPMTSNKFGRRLTSKGLERYNSNGTYYIGVGLLA